MRTSSSSRSEYFGPEYFGPDPFFDFSGVHCGGFEDEDRFVGGFDDDSSEHMYMDYEPTLTMRLEAVKKRKRFCERL
jgi:hypothetical protein